LRVAVWGALARGTLCAMPVDSEMLALESAAFEAWQAEDVAVLGPWRLRFMHGVTSRANSVWAGPGEPARGFARAIDEVEAWYAARKLAPTFQLAPIADPRLDALLGARGYAVVDPVSVQVADAARVAALPPRAGTTCESALSEDWFALSGTRGRFHGTQVPVYRALLERIAPRAGFALARDELGNAAAVGLTIVQPPYAGVFSMLTLPEQRRRGHGAALLGELARFALACGASQLYLQVELENAGARELYARAGFVESHRYWYRRRA
jgi:ribosomal protein S18 acetylase RimI-like enzyme